MGAVAIGDAHLGFQREFLAEDAHDRLPVGNASSERVGRLPAGDEHHVVGIGDGVFEMVLHAARFCHARSADDDHGVGRGIERFRLFDAVNVLESPESQRIRAFDGFQQGAGLAIIAFRVLAEDFGDVDGKRAIHVDGHFGNAALVVHFMQGVDDFLGAAHGKCGDDDAALAADGVVDNVCQLLSPLFNGRMLAIAIRAFEHEIVGWRHGGGIADNGETGLPQITAEEQAHGPPALLCLNEHHRRAENMPGIEEGDAHIAGDFQRVVVAHAHQALQGKEGILFGVERRDGGKPLARAFLVGVSHIGFLDATRIGEHGRAEIAGGVGGIDRRGTALRY